MVCASLNLFAFLILWYNFTQRCKDRTKKKWRKFFQRIILLNLKNRISSSYKEKKKKLIFNSACDVYDALSMLMIFSMSFCFLKNEDVVACCCCFCHSCHVNFVFCERLKCCALESVNLRAFMLNTKQSKQALEHVHTARFSQHYIWLTGWYPIRIRYILRVGKI